MSAISSFKPSLVIGPGLDQWVISKLNLKQTQFYSFSYINHINIVAIVRYFKKHTSLCIKWNSHHSKDCLAMKKGCNAHATRGFIITNESFQLNWSTIWSFACKGNKTSEKVPFISKKKFNVNRCTLNRNKTPSKSCHTLYKIKFQGAIKLQEMKVEGSKKFFSDHHLLWYKAFLKPIVEKQCCT